MTKDKVHHIIYATINDIIINKLFQTANKMLIDFKPDTIISTVLSQTSMTILLIHLEEIFALKPFNLKIILEVTTFKELTEFTQQLINERGNIPCSTQRRFLYNTL